MPEQFVLLWSQQQNALHIETLERHASLNREAFAADKPGDYRLLLVGTRADADNGAALIRKTLAERKVCTRCGQEGHRSGSCPWPAETGASHAAEGVPA